MSDCALPGLTRAQVDLVRRWFPHAQLVADHSWGLTDTAVLHLRTVAGDVVVKAGARGNHHIGREITAHEHWVGVWARIGRAPTLLHAARDQVVLATAYLPGRLVQDDPAEHHPDTYRQAGLLLSALHDQAERVDAGYEAAMDAKALAWLDRPHRIAPQTERRLRERVATHPGGPATLVPTHGDWQPRNWLVDDGRVSAIDFGRADWRTADTDLARLAVQQFVEEPDLEAAFLDGYGRDPRDPEGWTRVQLREAIGTAVWAHQVGDDAFEAQGHAMIHAALDAD